MADRVLIITRADSSYGYEHISRCTTLARHLRTDLDANVQVVLLGDENALIHARRQEEHVLFFPSWELRWSIRRKLLADLLRKRYPFYKPHLVVFDTYDFADTYWGRELFRDIFPLSSFLGLDIYPHRSRRRRPERRAYRPVSLDCIINSQLAPFGSNEDVREGVKHYYGTDYLILPLEIMATPPWRLPKGEDASIPVFFGGKSSPATRRMLAVLSGPRFKQRSFRLFSDRPQLARKFTRGGVTAEKLPQGVEFYRAFRSAPFGVVSCGSHLYSLAYLGVPLVVCPIGAHEISTAEKTAAAGYGLVALPRTRNLEEQLEHTMRRLSDPEFARRQSERGRQLIDGKGIRRVTVIVKRALEKARRKLA